MGTYAITGGSSGIGAQLGELLQDQEHDVINVDLNDGDIIADLATAAGRQSALAAVRERAADGLDGVVPLAGISPGAASGRQITAVNYYGTVELVEGLRDRLAKKRGAVVLLCSNSAPMSAAQDPLLEALLEGDEQTAMAVAAEQDNGLHYMTGKRALAYWMRRHAMAYARDGIRMNAVAPGPIDTPMTRPLFDDPGMAQVMQELTAATPLGRIGQPAEVARAISFLLGPDASYICGSLLYVDGGYDAHSRSDHI